LGETLRRLHAELNLARQRAGRGPSGIMLWSALERCATRYFEGTVLRSLRGSPRLARQLTFAAQIGLWAPSLNTPATSSPPSQLPTPPSPPTAA
jgi:hypothetical protein